jgi:Luciferase-like monooxygenase
MRFVVRIHQDGWSFPELAAVWQESERLGYHGVSLYDVLGISGPECWTALTALTAATRKLVAVPLVLANPYRHPAVTAKMAATLDAFSPGGSFSVWAPAVPPPTRPRSGSRGPPIGSGSRRSGKRPR